jgi:hypothetical protein
MANINQTSANSLVAILVLAIVFAAGASALRDGLASDPAAGKTAPTGTGCTLGSYVGSFDDAYDTAMGVASARDKAACDEPIAP